MAHLSALSERLFTLASDMCARQTFPLSQLTHFFFPHRNTLQKHRKPIYALSKLFADAAKMPDRDDVFAPTPEAEAPAASDGQGKRKRRKRGGAAKGQQEQMEQESNKRTHTDSEVGAAAQDASPAPKEKAAPKAAQPVHAAKQASSKESTPVMNKRLREVSGATASPSTPTEFFSPAGKSPQPAFFTPQESFSTPPGTPMSAAGAQVTPPPPAAPRTPRSILKKTSAGTSSVGRRIQFTADKVQPFFKVNAPADLRLPAPVPSPKRKRAQWIEQ